MRTHACVRAQPKPKDKRGDRDTGAWVGHAVRTGRDGEGKIDERVRHRPDLKPTAVIRCPQRLASRPTARGRVASQANTPPAAAAVAAAAHRIVRYVLADIQLLEKLLFDLSVNAIGWNKGIKESVRT